MKRGIKGVYFLVALGVALLTFILSLNYLSGSEKFLRTSMVSILQTFAVDDMSKPVDLSIESVELREIEAKDSDFGYKRFLADVLVKNNGGTLLSGKVLLGAGKDQKFVFVKNREDGFTLRGGKEYLIEGYEIFVGENYNYADIDFEIRLLNEEERALKNNTFSYKISNLSSNETLTIGEINNRAEVKLSFDFSKFDPEKNDFTLFYGNNAVKGGEFEYREKTFLNRNFAYLSFANSDENLLSGLSEKTILKGDDLALKYTDNPFDYPSDHYAFLVVKNKENSQKFISNLIHMPSQQALTRATFAKEFVDLAEIELEEKNVSYFEDVKIEDDFSPYVQTLYGLGVINSTTLKFYPEEKVTRAEALRVIMDYFDADLTNTSGAISFEDVASGDILEIYLNSFLSGKKSGFGNKFMPDQPANKAFVAYLIKSLKK